MKTGILCGLLAVATAGCGPIDAEPVAATRSTHSATAESTAVGTRSTHADPAPISATRVEAVSAVAANEPPEKTAAPAPEVPLLAEVPKQDPEPKAVKPAGADAPLDMTTVLAEAGFEVKRDAWKHLPSYVRFGTKAVTDKYLAGDRFDKIEVEKGAKDHRGGVAKLTFRMGPLSYRPVVREDIESEGLIAEVALPMRLRGAEPFHEDANAFRGILAGLNPSEVDTRRFSFLTKDGQLRVCTPADAVVVKRNNGVLYYPEVANTTLLLVLKGKLDDLKDMSRNAGDYSVEIEFTALRFDGPRPGAASARTPTSMPAETARGCSRTFWRTRMPPNRYTLRPQLRGPGVEDSRDRHGAIENPSGGG